MRATRTVRLLVLVGGLGLGVVTAAPARAADLSPPVAFDLADSYALRVNRAPVTVVIPVRVGPTVHLDRVTASVAGVDQTTAEQLSPYFGAVIDAEQKSVSMTVGHARASDSSLPVFPRPGTYEVRLELSWTRLAPDPESAAATSPTIAVAKVELPTAVLAATPKLEVHQQVVCPLDLFCIQKPHTDPEALVVRETSGLADSGKIVVTVADAVPPDQGPPVTISSDGGDVGPGGTTVIPYTIAGDIDSGTAQATLSLGGERLAAPTSVEVAVTRRQEGASFVILGVVGLLIGFGIRKLLRDRIAKGDEVAQYNQQRAALIAGWHASTDSQLRTEIGLTITALDDAQSSGTPKTADAIAAAADDMKAKTDAYHTRLAKVTEDRRDFAASLEVLRYDALRVEVEQTVAGLAPIDQLIQQGNAKAAQDEIDKLQVGAQASLVKAAKLWAAQLGQAISAFGEADASHVPGEALDSFGDRVALLATVDAVRQAQWDSLPEKLASAAAAEVKLGHVLRAAVHVGGVIGERVPTQYLDSDLEPATRALDAVVSAGSPVQVGIPALAERLGQAIDRSVRAWIAGVGGSSSAEQQRIDRRYLAAVRSLEAPPARPAVTAATGARADERSLRLLGDEAPAPKPEVKVPPVPAVVAAPTPPPQPAGLGGHPGLTKTLKFILWVLGLAALLGTVYVVLPSAMVGTAVQQIGVLVWAASLPPTVEGFAGQLGKLAPAPAK